MHRHRAGRRSARAAATIALSFVVLVLGASAASAHATLRNSSPPQSAVFRSGAGPRLAVLVFDESVTASTKFLEVYDGAGHAVPDVAKQAEQRSTRVQAKLPVLRDGTYVAVWHIVSADGHPEQGAFTFTVGKGGATTADINGLLARNRASRGLGIGFGVVRALAFLGCLLFVGGLVFVRWAWPETLATRRVRLLLALSAYVAIAASLLSIPLEAAYSNASMSKLFDGGALSDVVHARFGTGVLWRSGLLLLMLPAIVAAVERGWSLIRVLAEGAVVVLALGVWATFAYAGHGDTGRLVPLGFATDVAHLAAASLWLGGLLALVVGLRGATGSENATRAAVRFSAVALPSIAVIVLSGVTQGWRQLGSWDALWHTTYGRLLIVKAGVVIGIVVIASAARDIVRDQLVPAVRGALRPASLSAAVRVDDEAVHELRNGMWTEAMLAVAVLGVTSVLVFTAPGREVEAAAARPVAHTVHASAVTARFAYQVAVQPAVPGPNTIVIAPTSRVARQIMPANATATMTVVGQSRSVRVPFTALPDGRFVASQTLSGAPVRLSFTTSDGTTADHAAVTLRISR